MYTLQNQRQHSMNIQNTVSIQYKHNYIYIQNIYMYTIQTQLHYNMNSQNTYR